MDYVWTALVTAIISGGIMFFVGANNPPQSIIDKILKKRAPQSTDTKS